jgi:hypothetical protein
MSGFFTLSRFCLAPAGIRAQFKPAAEKNRYICKGFGGVAGLSGQLYVNGYFLRVFYNSLVKPMV